MTYRRLPYEEYFINTSEDYTHTGRASYAVKYVAVKYNTTRIGKRLGIAHEVNYEIHYEPDRDVIQMHFQRTFYHVHYDQPGLYKKLSGRTAEAPREEGV